MNLTAQSRGADRVLPLRRWICVATVVSCLPYLLLKIAWIFGWTIGVDDAEFADTMRVANIATAGMELTAILIAVGLVAPWGK
ncbi:hypothetical protein [Rhodococcus sp. 105337]|nr:hypothetical protein [Rhodococcus sp. 105337]NME80369.1 hypothetical protein [Rhodococcus sp. 105337]